MARNPHPIHWLHHAGQRLGLVPSLGGGVAAWQVERPTHVQDLWRPWTGAADRYSLASFAMVPWSNRISAGGFAQDGKHYPMAPNRAGEPYPIHGDGWLQSWDLAQPAANTLEMRLSSDRFAGNPFCYNALQRFVLREGGMDQTLAVTHTGAEALPYGLGLHPWFLRSVGTRLQTDVRGVWLSGADPLPTGHTQSIPTTWDPRGGMNVNGTLVDNVFTGWSGQARITWPEQQLALTLRVPELHTGTRDDNFFLLYRPAQGNTFCFEPVTHPIDAFHLPERPGLRVLQPGESLQLHVEWRFQTLI